MLCEYFSQHGCEEFQIYKGKQQVLFTLEASKVYIKAYNDIAILAAGGKHLTIMRKADMQHLMRVSFQLLCLHKWYVGSQTFILGLPAVGTFCKMQKIETYFKQQQIWVNRKAYLV